MKNMVYTKYIPDKTYTKNRITKRSFYGGNYHE